MNSEIEIPIDEGRNITFRSPGSLSGRTWCTNEAQAEAERIASGPVEYLTWRGTKLIFIRKP